MRTKHRPLAAVALAAAALAPAAAAQAATKSVTLGLERPPAGLSETASLYDFFPRSVTIRAGDKVRYSTFGFGVVYSGPAAKVPPLAVPDAGAPVAGVNDPAGSPFWFNGQPSLKLNAALLAPSGDGKVAKGQQDVDHGALALGPGAKPYVLSFPKPGVYRVRDALHPDVVNTVKVVKKGKRVPGAAADRAAVVKQVAKLVKEAGRRDHVEPAPDTIAVGNDSRNVGFFDFFPHDLKVKAGTTVTIDSGPRVNDVHNLAIGPEAYVQGLAQGFFPALAQTGALMPEVVFPSQPSSLTFDGTQDGGYVNTGLLDTDGASPLPSSAKITFTKPGQYRYVCLLHSDGVNGMAGTITVE